MNYRQQEEVFGPYDYDSALDTSYEFFLSCLYEVLSMGESIDNTPYLHLNRTSV